LTTPNDVPAPIFIQQLAKHLKENVDAVTPPAWTAAAKTGMHVEKQPQDPNWWYTRCASILRKVYTHGPIGTEKLRAEYGGGKSFSGRPQHAAKSGGSSIRKALQQLQTAGFVEPVGPKGKRVSKKGRELMQEIADEVIRGLVKDIPELEKYQQG
jgi:small subunit ribosomal protein S19e